MREWDRRNMLRPCTTVASTYSVWNWNIALGPSSSIACRSESRLTLPPHHPTSILNRSYHGVPHRTEPGSISPFHLPLDEHAVAYGEVYDVAGPLLLTHVSVNVSFQYVLGNGIQKITFTFTHTLCRKHRVWLYHFLYDCVASLFVDLAPLQCSPLHCPRITFIRMEKERVKKVHTFTLKW